MANLPTMILCRGHNNPMLKCGRCKDSEFYKSRSEFAYYPETIKKEDASTGYLPFCKSCVQKIFETQLEHKKDMQIAFYYTCQKLDIPFIVELFDEVVLSKRDNNGEYANIGKRLVGEYIQRLNTNKTKYGSKLDFSYSDTTLSSIDVKIAELDNRKNDLDKFHLDWGTEHQEEEYAFLEYRYSIYTDGREISPAQETLYRQLCLVELAKRRKEKTKELTKDEQTMMLNLMDKLNIANFKEQRDKSDTERTIERQIWEIENTEPCELVDKEEYSDFLDINKSWGQHILRALRNLIAGTKDYPDVTKEEKWD